ncbi:MAG: hypothetical protein JW825_03875 [Candidatus Methanofastidiosa archaeon]|nr:hypothetical protein [Candidatus Methanofastidiosa archaeon]
MKEGEIIEFGYRKIKMLDGKYHYTLFNANEKSSDEKLIPSAKCLCDFINENSFYLRAFDFRRMKEVQAIDACYLGERIRTTWAADGDDPIYLIELWITSSEFLNNELDYYMRGEKDFLERAWETTYKACMKKYEVYLSGGDLHFSAK